MSYSDALRLSIQTLRANLFSSLQASGVIFAEREVKLATITTTNSDQSIGTPGTSTTTYVTLDPRPKVDLRDQWRSVGGAVTKVGDAMLSIEKGAVSRSSLEAADLIFIDGAAYTIAEGQIKETPMQFKVILRKARA